MRWLPLGAGEDPRTASSALGDHLCYNQDDFGPAKSLPLIGDFSAAALALAQHESPGRTGEIWRDGRKVCQIRLSADIHGLWIIEPAR